MLSRFERHRAASYGAAAVPSKTICRQTLTTPDGPERHRRFYLAVKVARQAKAPLQTSYAASVADTLFWPRRDHRRFLLPRPRIQDEPRDFACRIPDESDPGVIFVVYGEFVAGWRHERRRLAFLEFEDRPSPRRFRDELALRDANLKLDRINTAGDSHDAEIACAVLTLVDDFHLYRRVGRLSQLGQNIGEREAFERRVVKFSDEIARRHAGLGCGTARGRPVDPQALLLHGDERLDSKPSGFAIGQALPVMRTHRGAEVIGPDIIGERFRADDRRHCRRGERGRLGNRQCAIG